MAETFRAIYLTEEDGRTRAELADIDEARLPDGDVAIRVSHSTVNYKDGLAITGKGRVVRSFPMVPGIDLAGTVIRSQSPDWAPGDPVVLNGWGLGETHWGGLATMARVKSDWLIRKPDVFTASETMAIGTAGYTAALCVLALERHGLGPDDGDMLVTGAAGGVGSIAVALLARRGYRVVASTGRPQEAGWLKDLGAAEIVDRAALSAPGKPLGPERWAGAVDAVGSHTLANALAGIRQNGAVAACGLAQGPDLPGSVFPFILRGVALYGINSVYEPRARREAAWALLAESLEPACLAALTTTAGLGDAIGIAADILEGRVRGRIVIDMAADAAAF